MRSDEIIRLQALKLKEVNSNSAGSNGLLDAVLEQNPEVAKEKLRNICAFISPQLFDEVQSLCSLLDLSKRRFVEMALQDAIEKTHSIVNEVSPFREEQPC